MLFRRKIPCYVLVFDQVSIIQKSLDFITEFADRLDIVIIENPSDHTPEIKEIIDTYGKAKKIKRYYLFDENITGNAYDMVLTRELSSIQKSPYVLITDGDLTSKDTGWLDEEIAILKNHPDVFACGATMDKANLPVEAFPSAIDWIPPDMQTYDDFYEAYTGGHLLMFRGKQFVEFMDWKVANKRFFVDGEMHGYCYNERGMKWARTKKAKVYHYTWDLYQDPNHPYTKLKTNKSFQDTWYHTKETTYVLKEY